MKKPDASLIIAIDGGRHSNPKKTLDSIFRQTNKDFEIVIVDQSDGSDWVDTIKTNPKYRKGLRYYQINKPQRAAAWNFGVSKAHGKIIVFMGDDFIITERFIEKHIDAHKKYTSKNTVVIGPAVFDTKNKITKFMSWLEKSGSLFGVSFTNVKTIPKDFFWGANASLKKTLLQDVGGFDEDFPYHAWDDYELGLRLNKKRAKIHYEPKALAIHDHKVTMASRIESMQNAGESAVIFERKYPGKWPWQDIVAKKRLFYARNIISYLFLYLLTNNDKHLSDYFQSSMDLAFTRGYLKNASKRMH